MSKLTQEQLMPLIVSQLKSYGFYGIAQNLVEISQVTQPTDPSDKLAEMCMNASVSTMPAKKKPVIIDHSLGNYSNWFTTLHRGYCTTAAFSPDGNLIATGSDDTSLK